MAVADNTNLKPSPDDFLTIIRRQQLGKLKIYLGPCPGVGKTYQMLVEGNRLRRQGVDVVIGYVEPHNRPETTAQIGELEIVPPLVAKYHGMTLKEMDLDGVLARKPTIALVDELAHTNTPQSRNRKRYEDVQDLLRAGINIIATVNIQHFESLYNIVEEVTGVKVKERVPDEIITQADQVVNIEVYDVGRKQPPPAPCADGGAIIAQQCADIVAKTQHGAQQQRNQKQPNPSAAIPL